MLTMLAADSSTLLTEEFWVAIAFFGFVGLLLYYKVPALIGEALDNRAIAIRNKLDEARRLRDDAQALVADYQRKRDAAEDEAKSIIEQARLEAEALAAETRRNFQEMLERRTKLAEDKIARAEAQAIAEVRSIVVDTAIGEAERSLRDKVMSPAGGQRVDRDIRDLKRKLN